MTEHWPGKQETGMTVEINVPISMRDGTITRADIYLPKAQGRFPVLLQRTPYDKSMTSGSYLGFRPLRAVSNGYAVVIQDVRGRFASDGKFDPMYQEIHDGYDSVEWCAAQPWSTGKVGMYGGSYVGATQWLAAISGAPHLRCIVPLLTACNYYDDWFYSGGALQLSFVESWCIGYLAPPELERRGRTKEAEKLLDVRDRMDKLVFKFLPTKRLALFEGGSDYFYDWISHPDEDDYWDKINIGKHHNRIKVPALNVGGWYDIFLRGTINNFTGMKHRGRNEASRMQKLIIGPWMHAGRGPSYDKLVGDVDFGYRAAWSTMDMEGYILRWSDYWLKGSSNEIAEESPVRIFVMGENAWREEKEWPLARTRFTNYYMHSDGVATCCEERGVLDESLPEDETYDRFVYDPLDPVPTKGGALCCDVTFNPGGPYDQSPTEKRKDVLTYTTESLKRNLEITGPATMKLFASTSALDTDFTAKLVDLWPNGYAQLLTDGIIRGRYRESKRRPKLLKPGNIYGFEIDLGSVSNVFMKRHSIRLEISSSNFPRFDRNLNGGALVATEKDAITATQQIYHDAAHPSHLILPVVPR